jgi:hypothetical protein
VGTAGDGGVQILRPEPIPQDLIAVTRSVRPKPNRRLVGADGRATLEVFFDPLGSKRRSNCVPPGLRNRVPVRRP